MMGPLLLDTCAAIYVVEERLSEPAERLILARYNAGEAIYISAYSAWELALLFRRGRVRSSLSPSDYFRNLVRRPGFALAEASPEILIASWFLPGTPPKDPADRILAATARTCGYALLTRDRALLAYAKEGHLRAIPC